MVEEKLLGIDERPDDVFVSFPAFLRFLLEIAFGQLQFLVLRLPGVGPIVKLPDVRFGRLRVRREQRRAAFVVRQFFLNVFRIQKMEALSETGVLRALAFARARHLGPAKHGQEIGTRVETVVRQLNGARADRQAVEAAGCSWALVSNQVSLLDLTRELVNGTLEKGLVGHDQTSLDHRA